MSRLAPSSAALLAATSAWVSLGTIGLAGADGPRLAVLPLSAAALAAAAGAGAAVLALARAGASMRPLSLLALLLLPVLPVPVPAAFLIWTGPVAALVWAGVLLLMTASLPRARYTALSMPAAAAAAAAVLFSLAAWRAAPMVPGGDEPHYLVITQSLLLDGDLSIADVHRRGDYRAYYPGDLPPHVQRRGRDGQIYSVHAPGLPAIVAPAFAVAGYHGVVAFLIVAAAAGSALAWHLGKLATGSSAAAWFGWAAVTLPVTAIFQSFTVYPDGPGGVLALTGLWALLRAREESRTGDARALPWFLHGTALAVLPWLHSRFAVLACGFGALILLRLSATKNPAGKAAAFLIGPAVSSILWVGYFIAIYGTPDPSAPYAAGEMGAFAFVPGGTGGLLFDQRFGLLAYAPVLAVPFAGFGVMAASPAWRRPAIELLFVLAPYLVTVTHFAMWWGGWSAPARFFAPVLPLCALPAALAWTAMTSRVTRFLACASLAATAAASAIVIWVDRGRLAFNTREARALWLEWLGPVADLTSTAPLWARETDVPLFRAIGVWLAVIVAVWLALRAMERAGRLGSLPVLHTVSGAALACAVMVGTTVMWAIEGVSGRNVVPSQLRLLETFAAERRVLALRLDGWQRLPALDLPARLRIELSRTPGTRGPGREATVMFAVPPLPAGEYRLRTVGHAARGWLMAGIARDQFALRTLELPIESLALTFALPVRGLVVRGDEDARRTVEGLVIEPVRILRPHERLTGEVARRAVRYGDVVAFFLDDRSFPEPEAFWVGGGRESRVAVQPDAARARLRLRLRNGPVENRVRLQSGAWHQELPLSPGEERELDVPLDPGRGGGVLRIASPAGFRPSEHDPASRDGRFLGVWVKVVE